MTLNATPDPVHLPHIGTEVRLGKKDVKKDKNNLKLASYLPPLAKLPTPPAKVARSNLVSGYPMYGNDRYGDCTVAAVGHILQLAGAASGGAVVTPTDQEILDLYWATGDPPTPGADDNGRYCLDVLNYWRRNGVPGYAGGDDDLLAYLQINPKNHLHMKLAIWEFGAVYTGIGLPISAQSQRYWHVVSGAAAKFGSWGGHCVPHFDYNRTRINCCTWAAMLEMTWGFWDRYGDEAYVPLTRNWFNRAGDSPLGFKVDKLLTDLKALGITV